jgi:two-component system, OmpR family, phosphate regulon sensor histidine kinase PhoR
MLDTPKQLLLASENQLDHNRLLSLINGLTDGFLAVSPEGLIELSNGVALDLLDTNELHGKKLADAMPLTDAQGGTHDLLELTKSARQNFISRDYRLKYVDGSEINLYINVSVVKAAFGGHQKDGYVVLFRDITKEKSAEDERDEFISVASHELRNPVAIAEGGVSNAILLAERGQVPGSLIQVLKSTHEQIIFLSNLINDLATISRADRAKLAELASEFDANEIIESLKKNYAARAQKKGLEIKTEAGKLKKMYGSRMYTEEILQNFVTNAIKYTEKGTITIKAEPAGDGVALSVSDSGIGIDEEEQRKLFSKFFRSADDRVRKISGTGLGLYVCAKLAKLMGGSISMTSELNKGSTFTLRLPYTIK